MTTLNYNLQETAYDGMGSYDGAVVALEPSTGKILAMVSKPDFNPNSIAKDWDSLISGDSSELVNRATQGLYPPGSTFKIVTALAYMREHPDYANYTFDCTGTYNAGGYTIHCTGKRGSWTPDFPGGVREFLQLRLLRYGSVLECFGVRGRGGGSAVQSQSAHKPGQCERQAVSLSRSRLPRRRSCRLPSDRELR